MYISWGAYNATALEFEVAFFSFEVATNKFPDGIKDPWFNHMLEMFLTRKIFIQSKLDWLNTPIFKLDKDEVYYADFSRLDLKN